MPLFQITPAFLVVALLFIQEAAGAPPPPQPWLPVAPFTGTLSDQRGLDFNGAGVGVTVNASGTILRTEDGGSTWRKAFSAPTKGINCVAFVDSNTVVAVGNGSGVYRSTDAGLHWSTTNGDEKSFPAFGIDFGDDKVGVAVGRYGRIMRTMDGGASWYLLPPIPGEPFLSGVDFATPKVVVAVGEKTVHRSTDGGATWAIVPGISSVSGDQLRNVRFSDANTGIITGADFTILRTVDQGASWLLIEQIKNSQLIGHQDVAFGQDGKGIVVGNEQAKYTLDHGATWVTLADSGTYGARLVAKPYEGKEDWVIGFGHAFLRGRIGGPWNPAVVERNDGDMAGLAARSGGLVLAVGKGGNIQDFRNGNQESVRVGIRASAADLRAVAFGEADRGIIVGAGGTVLETSDGGQAWNPVALGLTDVDLRGVAFSGGIVCAVGSRGFVIRSGDGGLTWAVARGGLAEADLHSVAFSRGRSFFAVGDSGRILVSRDMGDSWNRIDHGQTDRSLLCLAFGKDGLLGLAGGVEGILLRTLDGGETWSRMADAPAVDSILSVGISDSGMAVAVFSGQGGIWGTVSKGGKWLRLAESNGLRAFRFADATHGVAVGVAGKASRSGTVDGILGALETLRPVLNSLTDPRWYILGWKPATWAEGYRVVVSSRADLAAAVLDTLVVSDSALSLQGVDTTRGYYWNVRAVNALGAGPASPTAWFGPVHATSSLLSSTSAEWTKWSSPARITAMDIRDSILWVATDDGLARLPLKGGNTQVLTTRNSGLLFDSLYTVHASPDGEVWLGTPKGAQVLKDGHWTVYNKENSPLKFDDRSALVSSIAKDRNGTVWIGTAGIVRTGEGLEYDINKGRPPVFHYDYQDSRRGRLFTFDGVTWMEKPWNSKQTDSKSVSSVDGIASDSLGNVRVHWFTQYRTYMIEEVQRYLSPVARPRTEIYPMFGTYNFKRAIYGMQANSKGAWLAYHSTSGAAGVVIPPRALYFRPNDTTKESYSLGLSTDADFTTGRDAARFGSPLTLFSLHPSGELWLKVLDTVYKYQDTVLVGIETLPPDIADKGPFREIKVDPLGILLLRNDKTVFWKAKVDIHSTLVGDAAPRGELALARTPGGWAIRLPASGRVRLEYLSLLGSMVGSTDLGQRDSGTVALPLLRSPGPFLLKVDVGKSRRYFLMEKH